MKQTKKGSPRLVKRTNWAFPRIHVWVAQVRLRGRLFEDHLSGLCEYHEHVFSSSQEKTLLGCSCSPSSVVEITAAASHSLQSGTMNQFSLHHSSHLHSQRKVSDKNFTSPKCQIVRTITFTFLGKWNAFKSPRWSYTEVFIYDNSNILGLSSHCSGTTCVNWESACDTSL